MLDLASLDSVRTFAAAWQRERRPLHILVNNAGIFSMGGMCHTLLLRSCDTLQWPACAWVDFLETCGLGAAGRTVTRDGFEAHMGTNYLGPFLLTMLLLPNLLHTAKTVCPCTSPSFSTCALPTGVCHTL